MAEVACFEEGEARTIVSAQMIIFAESGLTLAIDGRRLNANVSFREAEIWREILFNIFPANEIEIVWCSQAGPVPVV